MKKINKILTVGLFGATALGAVAIASTSCGQSNQNPLVANEDLATKLTLQTTAKGDTIILELASFKINGEVATGELSATAGTLVGGVTFDTLTITFPNTSETVCTGVVTVKIVQTVETIETTYTLDLIINAKTVA